MEMDVNLIEIVKRAQQLVMNRIARDYIELLRKIRNLQTWLFNYLSARRFNVPGDDPKKRCLACAIGPNQTQSLPRQQLEANVRQRLAVWEDLAYVLKL